jgi:hypothetical protein
MEHSDSHIEERSLYVIQANMIQFPKILELVPEWMTDSCEFASHHNSVKRNFTLINIKNILERFAKHLWLNFALN